MRRAGASLALSASLLAGCGNSGEQIPPANETVESSSVSSEQAPAPQTYQEQVAELGRYVTAVQAYWAKQGINVGHTKVEIVEGDETVSCGQEYPATSIAGGYCHTIDTFFATQAFIRYVNSDQLQPLTAQELPRLAVVAAHEYGHVVQYDMGITRTSQDYLANKVRLEQQADCFAGQTIQAIDPASAKIALSPDFVYLPGDANYGTTEARERSFIQGFRGSGCT